MFHQGGEPNGEEEWESYTKGRTSFGFQAI